MTEEQRLLLEMGFALQNINDTLEDEGDRVYLASTNHKNVLQEFSDRFTEYWFELPEAVRDEFDPSGKGAP